MIFLFPTELEAQPFRSLCPHAQVVICGVGAAECAATTAAIITEHKLRGESLELVLAGIAGSYSLKDVAICDVVEVVSEYIAALPPRFAVRYSLEPQTFLRSVSSNTVNKQGESPTTAQIENMEGSAFMAVCAREGVKHLQIRAVSNGVGDNFVNWLIDEACEALACELFKLLKC